MKDVKNQRMKWNLNTYTGIIELSQLLPAQTEEYIEKYKYIQYYYGITGKL